MVNTMAQRQPQLERYQENLRKHLRQANARARKQAQPAPKPTVAQAMYPHLRSEPAANPKEK